MLLALGFANVLMSDQAPIGMIERMPIVIALGFSLATLIDFWHWGSPQSISSGPNGIVRSKGIPIR
ncbi:hypothetical protein ACFSQU_08145 [Massilia sp. GCM10020059]|uniref:Uncharacterized protein n=1 Tax=Massilia agrisoli TaxID=2892444 RepID=A0ABS8IXK3_9BURK|nr:hypothetical protein [Massilia agrisoli]MCC6072403.1 hypothetical protein [Massilia agrisoli]